MKSILTRLYFILPLIVFNFSCSQHNESKAAQNDSLHDTIEVEPKIKTFLNEGKSLFKSNCASCHGVIELKGKYDFEVSTSFFINQFRKKQEHKKLSILADSSLIIIKNYFSKPIE